MATTRQRRALTQTRTVPKTKPSCSTGKPTATDQLADALRSKLTITDGTSNKNGKKKASESREAELTVEDKRIASMRAVNDASQTLSSIVQSGWKKGPEASSGKTVARGGTLSKAMDAAELASKHLVVLRCLSPNDINVERAAISVSGKLMAIEMHDAAFAVLKDMRPRLCAHLKVSSAPSPPQELVPYLSLPLSSSSAEKAEPTLLTIISTYLSYSLCIVVGVNKGANLIHSLADFLDSANPKAGRSCPFTLLHWLQYFVSLPSKHLDSLISRVYNSLTKFCTASLSPPVQQRPSSKKTVAVDMSLQNDAYRIRIYALQCLAYSTDEVVAPGTIWEQAMRYGNAYINSIVSQSFQDSSEHGSEATRTVLSAHSELVDTAESLPSHERFMKAKSFTTFLEWWMTFARRASDLQALNRISTLMHAALQSSTASSTVQNGPSAYESPAEAAATAKCHEKERNSKTIDTLVLRSAHIGTVFAQITTHVDLLGKERSLSAAEEFISQTRQVLPLFSTSKSLQELLIASYSHGSSALPVDASSNTLQKAGDKCARALERLRKSAIEALEAISPTDYVVQDGREALVKLLEGHAGLFDRAARSRPCTGFFTHALDTLFALARATLVANDPRTHDPAYRHLEQAIKLLHLDHESSDDTASLDIKDFANYVRCLSGTFYNLAGTLYQAGRFGTAVGFLIHGCRLGQKALSMHLPEASRTKNSSGGGALVTAFFQREDDGWHQLEEQMYRRWELLGVCYAKISDRKNAYTAFVECIKAFPYNACGFVKKAQRLSLTALFESTPALRQLGSIIDRVTYMATAELFLEPVKVSLSHPSLWIGVDEPSDDVIGTLLERQICSLESSRWKSDVKLVLARLLLDANEKYPRNVTPVRKARLLLRWLEFAYHGGLAEERFRDFQGGTVTEVAEEVESLLTREDLAQDGELAVFRAQYRASAHLWCALHAHYNGDINQSARVAEHAEQASSIMKKLLNDITRPAPRKSLSKTSRSSPKKTPPKRGGTRKVAAGSGGSRPRVARKITIKEPVTPKPKAIAVLHAIPLNSASPPKTLPDPASNLVIDDFNQFLKLLQTTARILGLLALILPKVHVLDVTRKICERYAGVANDGYVSASIDLAHEYVKLGKLRRASAVFNHALNSVRSGQVSDDICALFLLRYAEAFAVLEDVHQSSSIYCEALVSSQRCVVEEKNMPTLQKIQLRVKRLERAAMAAHVFALIQHSRNDIISAIDGMLRSLRLWNRAADALSRLSPSPSPKEPEGEKDVFEVTLQEPLPITEPTSQPQPQKKHPKSSLDSLEWRISEGLLSTLFSLSQIYFFRGSAKEAEYFAQQAHDLSHSLNAPALESRALAKKGEILLQLGKLEGAHDCLAKASEILANIPGIDSADVFRLRGDHSQRAAKHEDAQQMYVETTTMLEELDNAFKLFDGLALGPRKSAGLTPSDKPLKEMVVPELLASVLRQQIWLLRNEGGDEYMALLEKLMALPYSSRTKAEENGLMAQLTLHNVYSRFRNDMFLSSLCESAIASPMCMTSKSKHAISPTSQDLLNILDNAAKLFWANLSLISANGNVPDVRNATTSLALISAFQTSLGRPGKLESILAATLLDVSSSITLQRELLEAIPYKFLDIRSVDDLEWPLISTEGKPLPRPSKKPIQNILDTSDEDEDEDLGVNGLKDYWDSIREKYQSQVYDAKSLASSLTHQLPSNWTVVHINITTDKSTLFVSRQRGGIAESSPLLFCVPIKGRRDSGTGDEDESHLTFESALAELHDVIRLSDKGTKAAAHINPKDELARAHWWKERRELDQRLKELLENIEFCWLGAFKTILNPTTNYPSTILADLRVKLEKLFQQCLRLQDKQSKTRNRKNGGALEPSVSPSELTLADELVECFSTLSPKCRNEELEDLIYFVLDLYQFHGIRVAIAEIDMTQLAVDLRAALEEHAARSKAVDNEDGHTFLVLGKDLQGIPWESIPVLRGRSVSRIPSLHFLLDRVGLVNRQRATSSSKNDNNSTPFGAHINPRNGYYVLNPSGDLGRTQDQFSDWVKDMEKMGWHGTIGHPPSEQEFLDALQRQDLVVYFGHGGGEQYVRTHKIRNLARCAATMLWGCSSGALREMGDFDRTGTPNSYFVAGCPTLKLHLSADHLGKVTSEGKRRHESHQTTSVVTAVAQSREVCKLKYLTGAAPVVYGIPFYL
ncbi:cysteine peptidase C50 [Amanita muscaria]